MARSRASRAARVTGRGAETPALYSELAPWWPLMSAPAEYAEEAAIYLGLLLDARERPARTLLELGSGGGNNASYMKRHFEHVVLVDASPGMLDVSRRLNPDCEHVQGDIRSVRLDRQFDRVFVHDAVMYMTTEADLRRAIDTVFVHCSAGGVALLVPDCVKETFQASTDHGGHDGEGRGMRFLEWCWDPDPDDSTYFAEYAYLLREADGAMRVVHDRHVEGLFPRATWLRLLAEAGFRATVVPIRHSDLEGDYELFLCRRPAV